MAVCMMMRFGGDAVSAEDYAAVMTELGLSYGDNPEDNWPDGVLSHCAGACEDGSWMVIDVWRNQQMFEEFLTTRLAPAFTRATGKLPTPEVTSFHVENLYRHGAPLEAWQSDARTIDLPGQRSAEQVTRLT